MTAAAIVCFHAEKMLGFGTPFDVSPITGPAAALGALMAFMAFMSSLKRFWENIPLAIQTKSINPHS
jgi:hypothetical protein